MAYYAHKSWIRERLSQPLPGERAHSEMMSYRRDSGPVARKLNPPPRLSAVTMLLFPGEDGINTVFMQRPEYDGVHSGQLSFPGGKMEEDDTDIQATALRELSEETGIRPDTVEVLGTLTDVYIPPSHFLVTPFIGWMEERPAFVPDSREVSELIEYPIQQIFAQREIQTRKIFIPAMNVHIQAPYIDIGGRVLWGATAMMVHEFRRAVAPEWING